MKKIIALIISAAVLLALSSCGDTPEHTQPSELSSATERTEQTASETDPNAPVLPTGKETIDGTNLVLAIGCADENGVYRVPDGITFICENAFAYDKSLRQVILPSSVTTIGSNAFDNCTSLKNVVMTDSVTSIGSLAFKECTALEKIALPSNLETLLPYTFYGCSMLSEVVMPSGLKIIDAYCFAGCSSLLEINFPETLESMGAAAFAGCVSLRNPNGFENTKLTSIPSNLFASCISLKKIILPESVTVIEYGAFTYCSNITDVYIPSGVTEIGMMALNYTPWYYENTDKFLIVGDGVLIKSAFNPNTAQVPGTLDLSGLGIKSIGNSCFADVTAASIDSVYGYAYSSNIKYVIIPEGVEIIGDGAFYSCTNILNIDLPSTIVIIGGDAFFGQNTSEATVSFAKCKNLHTIGETAFYGCYGIEELDLPESVKYIGNDAFTQTKANFDFTNKQLESDEQTAFKIVGDGVLLWTYVAKGVTEIKIPNGVKYIAGGACKGWDSIVAYGDFEEEAENELIKVRHRLSYNVTSIEIPDSVVYIGGSAFLRDMAITSLNIPSSVSVIDSEAFSWCSSLSSITFGTGLSNIGSSVFSNTALTDVVLPESLQTIGSYAFYYCGTLKTLTIPQSVYSIGACAVNGMSTVISRVELPKELRPNVFFIVEIYIPSVTSDTSIYIKYN